MENKNITTEDILSIPNMNIFFAKEEYKNKLNEYVQLINNAQNLDPQLIHKTLVLEYYNYSGKNIGYRTALYYFADTFLNEHEELWNEEDKERGIPDLMYYFNLYYTEDKERAADYEICRMDKMDFLTYGFGLIDEQTTDENLKAILSYVIYLQEKAFYIALNS